ncbi:MAG: hypothetical protein ACK49F_09135 [Bacteroidota bacterium]
MIRMFGFGNVFVRPFNSANTTADLLSCFRIVIVSTKDSFGGRRGKSLNALFGFIVISSYSL